MANLSSVELATYHDKGWVVPNFTLPPELLAEMRAEYQALLDRNSHIASDIMLAPHQTNGSQGVIGSDAWLRFATHPDLVAMAADLIGEDIILWGTTFFG